jgi:hypothetical protein
MDHQPVFSHQIEYGQSACFINLVSINDLQLSQNLADSLSVDDLLFSISFFEPAWRENFYYTVKPDGRCSLQICLNINKADVKEDFQLIKQRKSARNPSPKSQLKSDFIYSGNNLDVHTKIESLQKGGPIHRRCYLNTDELLDLKPDCKCGPRKTLIFEEDRSQRGLYVLVFSDFSETKAFFSIKALTNSFRLFKTSAILFNDEAPHFANGPQAFEVIDFAEIGSKILTKVRN